MKHDKPIAFATYLCISVLLFIYLQTHGRYLFFFLEQAGLFTYDANYLLEALSKPSGIAAYLATFVTQFWSFPCGGALSTTLVTLLAAWCLFKTLNRYTAPIPALLFSIAATIPQAILSLDPNYSIAGLISYLTVCACLAIYSSYDAPIFKTIFTIIITPALFWVTGPSAILLPICIILSESKGSPSLAIQQIIPFAAICIIAAISIHNQTFGEWRLLILSDNYYSPRLTPPAPIYIAWALLPLLWALLWIPREQKATLTVMAGILLTGAVIYTGRMTEKPSILHELDYHLRNRQWKELLNAAKGRANGNHLYSAIKNIAIAESGRLSDDMLSYSQTGPDGLYFKWEPMTYPCIMMSDLYWSMGHIALSQQMAFEANVSFNNRNPRMLQRLIDTNIVFGEYAVAEKYISVLERSLFYKDWAERRREMLGNEEAIGAGKEISSKRKCIPAGNFLSGMRGGNPTDLAAIARQNPQHTITLDYLGCIYLLACDLHDFMAMIDEFLGSEALPELPRLYQEAIIIQTEHFPEQMSRYPISDETLARYAEFKKFYLANKNSPSLNSKLEGRYGSTYWTYFLTH